MPERVCSCVRARVKWLTVFQVGQQCLDLVPPLHIVSGQGNADVGSDRGDVQSEESYMICEDC
jgi:hypothetical protein